MLTITFEVRPIVKNIGIRGSECGLIVDADLIEVGYRPTVQTIDWS